MVSDYPDYPRGPMREPMRSVPRIDAGRLWAGGVATAVVAALVATLGILVARGFLRVAIFAPKADGVWGNANTMTYALTSAVIALLATGVLHFLLVTTPSATVFFTWIMVLLMAVAVVVPLTLVTIKVEMFATIALDVLIGLVITGLLVAAANGARARMYRPMRHPGYDDADWYGR